MSKRSLPLTPAPFVLMEDTQICTGFEVYVGEYLFNGRMLPETAVMVSMKHADKMLGSIKTNYVLGRDSLPILLSAIQRGIEYLNSLDAKGNGNGNES